MDQNLVRKLARGLYDAIKLQTRDLDLYEPFGRKRYIWSTNFRFKDVRGTNRGATVTLIQAPIPGGSAGRVFPVDAWADTDEGRTLTVRLNSKLNREALAHFGEVKLITLLRSTLEHEIGHMMDVIPSGTEIFDPRENPEAYYNSPHEVKAYLINIISEVRNWMEEEGTWLKSMTRDLVLNALDHSPSWELIKPHLTERNKKHILTAVYRAVKSFR